MTDEADILLGVLSEWGKPIKLRTLANGTYDETTGNVVQTPTDRTVRGAIISYRDNLIDGSSIKRGDRRVIIPARDLTVEPEPETYQVVDGSTVYQVVDVKRHEARGSIVAYTMQVRR
ncbi:MAG: hypothetical protein ACK53W_12630 [Gemmatimonadota bacterium]